MKQKAKQILNSIKKINFKSRSVVVIIACIFVVLVSGIIYMSYSYYENKTSNFVIGAYALVDDADIKLKIYRENKDVYGNGLSTYSEVYYVPKVNYTYNATRTECSDGLTITNYVNFNFTINAANRGFCKVFFDATDGFVDDYEVRLFIEKTLDGEDYYENGLIPEIPNAESGYYYTINNVRTTCTNGGTASIVGREIVVTTSQKTICSVYVDKNEETTLPVISELNVDAFVLSATVTDNYGLAGYGISTSNTTEPTIWLPLTGTSASINEEINELGTYYLWVKDAANNKTVSSSFIISVGNLTIANVTATLTSVSATLRDDAGLSGYAVTTSSSTPTTWTGVSGISYNMTYDSVEDNTPYYLHVKNMNNEVKSVLLLANYSTATAHTLPVIPGTYKLEVWGAQGGTLGSKTGGKGGYSYGTLQLSSANTIYVYVGGAGASATAGYNGGGGAASSGAGGGGGTDMRINSSSTYARVIVAGGGGGPGQDSCATTTTGFGGGISGGGAVSQGSCGTQGGGGTQNAGGSGGIYSSTAGAIGSFGQGAIAIDGSYDGGGGGGGWYGGGAGASAGWSNAGGGGSGYVYTSETASSYPSGCLLNSSYYLTNASTTAGDTEFISPSGAAETGHAGNGYARITYVP